MTGLSPELNLNKEGAKGLKLKALRAQQECVGKEKDLAGHIIWYLRVCLVRNL